VVNAAPELPAIEDRTAFNIERWEQLCADPFLAGLDHRIETDAHGHILMTPPAAFDHSHFQGNLIHLLKEHSPTTGIATPEAPISTAGGVKVADAIWISRERLKRSRQGKLLAVAPEICIEVLSPSNTRAEIDEKMRLYFDAGADEVWICGLDGTLRFFLVSDCDQTASSSALCPEFPPRIDLDAE
jgi:Uma2 family endonuclease